MSKLRLLRLFAGALWATFQRRRRHGPRRPSWSFGFEWLVEFLRRDWTGLATWPVLRARADLECRPMPRDALRHVERIPIQAGGVPGVLCKPAEVADDSVLLYLHGGSYLFGSTRTHADLMARLALAANTEVLGIDYRLAPEHPYPAALEDALSAYGWLVDRVETSPVPAQVLARPPSRVVVAGESAGGNLALALLIALRDAGRALPAGAVLISPWVDLDSSAESMQRNADFDYGTRDMLVAQARLFAGGIALSDARISPLYADLAGLPRLLVQVGDAELLEDECRELARRAAGAGVDVTLDVLADMPHAAPLMAAFAAEGQRAIERAAAFVRSCLE